MKNVRRIVIDGRLPRKNLSYGDAKAYLSAGEDEYSTPALPASEDASPYLGRVYQGATLFPRNFWFVEPSKRALVQGKKPYVVTADDIDGRAKKPWKGRIVRGEVEPEFLYSTAIAEDLVPFAIRNFRLLVIPMLDGQMLNAEAAVNKGRVGLGEWMKKVERVWADLKRPNAEDDIARRVDFQSNLTRQTPDAGYLVLHNASGSRLAATVVNCAKIREAGGTATNGFVVDSKMYHLQVKSLAEAHYLAALLNSATVDNAIKPFQTKGRFGAGSGKGQRDIHRRPYEIVPIPKYDASADEHQELSDLGKRCRNLVAKMNLSGPDSGSRIGQTRNLVRRDLAPQLREIEDLAKKVVGAASPTATPSARPGKGQHALEL